MLSKEQIEEFQNSEIFITALKRWKVPTTDLTHMKFVKDLSSMSNSNELYVINDGKKDSKNDHIIVRYNHKGNSGIISRCDEMYNTEVFNKLGVSPSCVFLGEDEGFKFSHYIKDTKICTTHVDDIKKLCKQLGKLHFSKSVLANIFDPFKLASKYFKTEGSSFEDDMKYISNELKDMKLNSSDLVPCQIDLVPENVLIKGNRAYLIDHEYSGLYYKEWDIADFACEIEMDDDMMIYIYEVTTGVKVNRRLYYLMKALSCYVWTHWALFYYGNDYTNEYYIKRYSQADEFLEDYKIMKNGGLF